MAALAKALHSGRILVALDIKHQAIGIDEMVGMLPVHADLRSLAGNAISTLGAQYFWLTARHGFLLGERMEGANRGSLPAFK